MDTLRHQDQAIFQSKDLLMEPVGKCLRPWLGFFGNELFKDGRKRSVRADFLITCDLIDKCDNANSSKNANQDLRVFCSVLLRLQ